MKILMLNYEYPPLGGGAGNATAYLLKEFSTNPDLHIDLVTSSTGSETTQVLSKNITIRFLDIGKDGNLHFQSNTDLLKYSARAYLLAKNLIKYRNYDLCHSFFGIPCGYLSYRLGLPYIVSLRGSDVPFYNERFYYLDKLIFKRMSIKIWKNARFVIANSIGLRDLALESAPNQEIGIIPNGIDATIFHPKEKDGIVLKVICVSRLIQRKGLEYLIRAMAVLKSENLVLELAGTGNQEVYLRDLVKELDLGASVSFVGAIPHDKIHNFYQNGDIFILPSLNEGMSNTVLEAMACGLPIVMTQTGGADELLEDGGNGYIIEKNSVEDIVRVLRIYLENRQLLLTHGRESRQIAEGMSWSMIANQYKDIYTKML